MKKLLLVLGNTGFFLANAGGATLFYDGFDYSSGSLLAPLNDTSGSPNPGLHNVAYNVDWRYAGAGGVVNNTPSIASAGLSYPGLQPATGNSALFDVSQIGSTRIQVAPSAINSGTVYWSALLRIDTLGTLTSGANGMLLGGFNNAAGAGTLPTTVDAVLRIRKDAALDVYYVGTAMNSGTAAGNIQFDTTPRSPGDTLFVVGAYEFVTGTFNDTARMWINPLVSDFGAVSPPSALLTSTPGGSVAELPSLLSFNLRNVNTVGLPTGVHFDELRVGESWADVTPVPEPAWAGLFGLGMLIVVGRWIRKR